MYIIGIDPGASGAIAIISSESGEPITVYDMPMRFLMQRKKSKEKKSKYLKDGITLRKKQKKIKQDSRRVLDSAALALLLRPYLGKIEHCLLEHVSSRTAQGVKSVFSFGECFGAIKGVLEALSINYKMTTPISWQKEFGAVIKKDINDNKAKKEFIYSICKNIYPEVEYHGPKGGLRDGRSDALLIARYIYKLKENVITVGLTPF